MKLFKNVDIQDVESILERRMRELIQKLIDSNVSAYEIEKQTGFSRDTLSKIRNGHASIDNISLAKAEKLYKYASVIFKDNQVEFNMIDWKIKKECPDAFAVYAVLDEAEHDEWVYICESEQDARAEAQSQWNHLTKSEQAKRKIKAGIIAGYIDEDTNKVKAFPELENGDILADTYDIFFTIGEGGLK